jgi:NAD(P)-dependent dehydrogenase (short-subunit alcohol dehydrogenase family)
VDRRQFVYGSVLVGAVSPFAVGATPQSAFGPLSTAEEVTAGLNLSGKTAVVTGCTSGIGYEVMRALALRGAHVLGTGRKIESSRRACKSIRGSATPLALDLADFPSVVACANEIQAMNVSIDMLILNAGILLRDLQQVNGIEKHFVVNHLGHFILANRLLDKVLAAPQGRVVVVGSGNHRDPPPGGIQFDNLSGKGWSNRYHHSKLANGLFSLELARILRGTRATSNCVTPGATLTDMVRDLPGNTPASLKQRKSPAQGAATVCYVATNPALAQVSGEYFADCNPAPQGAYQKDAAMASRLWDVSAKLTRPYLAHAWKT